jgi:hypothetical protein
MSRSPARHSLMSVLSGLHEALHALFVQRQQAEGRRRRALQRRLLLGLELLWKIEEQVVLPAVADAAPAAVPGVTVLLQELELMRDLSLLSVQTSSSNRDMSMGVLEGLAMLHFARLQETLAASPGDDPDSAIDWPALEAETQGLLGRWRGEVATDGHIEDEEADPVGVAQR